MNAAQVLLAGEFATLPQLITAWATVQGAKTALADDIRTLSYEALDRRTSLIAAALRRDGVQRGEAVAICASSGVTYAEVFLGAVRAGAVATPIAPSSTPDGIAAQIADSGARILFLDGEVANRLAPVLKHLPANRVYLDAAGGGTPLDGWLTPGGSALELNIEPNGPFNLIYSSGTTGTPKGIVQSHAMRWAHMRRATYPNDAVTLLSTPLYSNTTLVSAIPTLAAGGTLILMAKFDAGNFLNLSERYRVTHTMLVPVQYRRLLDHPDFDRRDLSSYRMKFATSSPFAAELKREVLDRWPGGLIEFYGMTEGGGTCALLAHEYPDKLSTVGRPLPDHDVRIIDADGAVLKVGEIGEVVGRSSAMMTAYHNLPERTSEAEWWSAEGERFVRTGDLGRFGSDGFLTLVGRKKEMIISGGFNIYPGDLETALMAQPAVHEAAVVGIPSATWGETPVGFVVLKNGATVTGEELRQTANARLGKTQRLTAVVLQPSLPRSHIGKVLKAELRETFMASANQEHS